MGKALEWDTPEWRTVRDRKMQEWLGNDAAHCVIMLSTISETWDDLVDRDKEVHVDDICSAFIMSLIDLEVNAFWRNNKGFMFPIMVIGINAWMDSNALMEIRTPSARMQAFFLRNYCAELVQAAAFCVGGFSHMRKVSMEARAFLNHETYFEWEHSHA